MNKIRFAIGDCFLGKILVGATGSEICVISFADSEYFLQQEIFGKYLLPEQSLSKNILDKVIDFVEHPSDKFTMPLQIIGTPFQKKVWNLISNIPVGKTATYKSLAMALDAPLAARAVANACAANRIAVAIPCHRVVTCSGRQSGYAWGAYRKQALLAREAELEN